MKMNLARIVYSNTVKPVTACSFVVSVYSGGYSTGATDVIYNKMTPFMPFMVDIVYSAVLGICIGITYPISIPALLTLEYVNTR